MLRKITPRVIALLITLVMVGCGGGGSDSGTSPIGGDGGGGTGGGSGGGSTTVTATDIKLTLSSYTMANMSSEVVTATVTATDAKNNAMPEVPVEFSVDDGIIISSQTKTSTSTGVDRGTITAQIKIGQNFSNRLMVVTAKSGSLVKTATIAVTGANVTATVPPTVVKGAESEVSYRVADANGNPLGGVDFSLIINGAAPLVGVTNSNGIYAVKYTAPAVAGSIELVAQAAGVENKQTVLVSSGEGGVVPVAVGPVKSASLSATPSVVAVNVDGTTNNQIDLRALFVGENNKPIPNVRVRFYLPDPNSVGGSIVAGSSLFYSNTTGVILGAYRAGARSSPPDGVVVRACWDYDDFPISDSMTCPNGQMIEAKLTVAAEPLSVTIGSNNTITSEDVNSLTYTKKYVVMVVDAAGQPKANVAVSALLDLYAYRKGFYTFDGEVWNSGHLERLTVSSEIFVLSTGWFCPSEDGNRTGVLDAGEDVNGSGALEPRKADVSLSFEPSGTTGVTDASGIAVLKIQYPKSVATWIDYRITVRAGVLGTEGLAQKSGTLPASAAEIKDKAAPSFVVSPYGTVGRDLVTGANGCTFTQ